MYVGDAFFIFILALIIIGPERLPEVGREISELMVEFRCASDEFKMQSRARIPWKVVSIIDWNQAGSKE
jgi:Sec-independent protein translocase protein TatA